jgi:CO/xanthine dehydrogenase Mo-binding subunit/aerobic-type carbon monoxide dehydrogenase small subunit (CoxS/CutS family)
LSARSAGGEGPRGAGLGGGGAAGGGVGAGGELIELALVVNGEECQLRVPAERTLLDVLREDLGLTGAKAGCRIGVCGVCTVLLDGRAVRACRVAAGQIQGRRVQTIESRDRDALLDRLCRAVAERGAIQCGYCAPGILMAVRGAMEELGRQVGEELRERLRRLLQGHICRCTGYLPLLDGLAAAVKATLDASGSAVAGGGVAGESERQGSYPEALARARGEARYCDDLRAPRMLHARLVRSSIVAGRLRGIDVSGALEVPGVVAVLTAADIPGERLTGKARRDQPVLAFEEIRHWGEPVAVVVAETPEAAERGAGRVRLEEEPLAPLLDPEEALRPGAREIHSGGNLAAELLVVKGDPDGAFAEAARVISGEYATSRVEHGLLEPEAALAIPDPEGGLTVWAQSQNVYFERLLIARVLGVPSRAVRVRQPAMGAAFGKREDPSASLFAALAAWRLGRPVKLVLSREESFACTSKRHPFRLRYRTALDGAGRITGLEVRILADAGAYMSWTPNILRKAAVHAAGPYAIQNVGVEARAAYTNNPVSGAMRGYGAPQVVFASERQMDRVARELGRDPLAFRRAHLWREGATTATGQQPVDLDGLVWVCEELERAGEGPLPPSPGDGWRVGVGEAIAAYGVGYGGGIPDIGSCKLALTSEGRFRLATSVVDYGQGARSVLRRLAADTLGAPESLIELVTGDSARTPDSGSTVASRQTTVSGAAVRAAAEALRERLLAGLARIVGCSAEELQWAATGIREPSGVVRGWAELHGILSAAGLPVEVQKRHRLRTSRLDERGRGTAYAVYSYVGNRAVVAVHSERGEIRVLEVLACHDSGRIVVPELARGQVSGGVAMGLGMALCERFECPEGVPRSTNFDSYRVPRIGMMPQLTIRFMEREGDPPPKGLGEPAMLAVAPAIANAVAAALGSDPRELPLSTRPAGSQDEGAAGRPARGRESEETGRSSG